MDVVLVVFICNNMLILISSRGTRPCVHTYSRRRTAIEEAETDG
jgi:hypothetical protein